MNQQQLKDGTALFGIFVKGMAFAFTSGQAALPILEKEIVDKRGWMSDREFWVVPAISHSLPGVISLHNAIQYGRRIAGHFGAFMAVTATICTAFFSMLLVTFLLSILPNNNYVSGLVQGIRSVSIAVLLSGAVRLVRSCEPGRFSAVMIVLSVILPAVFRISTFYTIILCGIIGIIYVLTHPGDTAGLPESEEEE